MRVHHYLKYLPVELSDHCPAFSQLLIFLSCLLLYKNNEKGSGEKEEYSVYKANNDTSCNFIFKCTCLSMALVFLSWIHFVVYRKLQLSKLHDFNGKEIEYKKYSLLPPLLYDGSGNGSCHVKENLETASVKQGWALITGAR